jgi:hypothetical protein
MCQHPIVHRKDARSGKEQSVKKTAVIMIMALIVAGPVPVSSNPLGADSWQFFYKGDSDITYAFSRESIIRTGDRIEVLVRSEEGMTTDATITTVRYDLNCRLSTFRILEVVEDKAGNHSVCGTASAELAIRPIKHRHLDILRVKICP